MSTVLSLQKNSDVFSQFVRRGGWVSRCFRETAGRASLAFSALFWTPQKVGSIEKISAKFSQKEKRKIFKEQKINNGRSGCDQTHQDLTKAAIKNPDGYFGYNKNIANYY